MKTGKSKVVKCDFSSEFKGQHGTIYSFNVELEDGTKGLYRGKSKDNPKFKVGEIVPYTAEEMTSKNGKTYTVVKYRQENNFSKGRPSYSVALEQARKMFNSSAQTDDVWDLKRMMAVASYLLKKLNSGISKDAIETAVTIQCAAAMHGQKIDAKTLEQHIKEIENWINQNK